MAQLDLGVSIQPEGANVAFLLVHGFCASPDEIASLGSFLEKHNIASYSVRIAGHGTTPEDLASTKWQDWYESIVAGLDVVRSWKLNHLFVAGFSMGGGMTVLLASQEKGIDGIVLISPSIKIFKKVAKFISLIKIFKKYVEVDLEENKRVHGYDLSRTKYAREPLTAYHEFLKFTKRVQQNLHKVTIPTLIMQGTADKTISPTNATLAFEGISSKIKEMHMIEGAEHVIPIHPTRAQAYTFILPFIGKVLKT